MLLTSVIIILREVLEAALIVCVLLAVGRTLPVRQSWLWRALGIGLLGALLYAGSMGAVSDWFDGVGQEVVNAFMQIVIYFCIAMFVMLFSAQLFRVRKNHLIFEVLMIASVSLTITREGSEILLYLSSFSSDLEQFTPILVGSLVGASIGISVGALGYFLLLGVNRAWITPVSTVLLSLVGAGMLGQASLQLMQADWLVSGPTLWDSSGWLPEDSVTGQLLYALIGYEATPSAVQASIYFAGLLLPMVLIIIAGRRQTIKPEADLSS
jgi:high-affinity iron transporter